MLGIKKQHVSESVVGQGMRVQGPCTFRGSLHIHGAVHGDVSAEPGDSLLVIGRTGSVHGNINAQHVVIAGTVQGQVFAQELLELQAEADVQGDVQYRALQVQQGARMSGQLQPRLQPPSAPAEPVVETSPVMQQPGAPIPEDSGPSVQLEPRLDPLAEPLAGPRAAPHDVPAQDRETSL